MQRALALSLIFGALISSGCAASGVKPLVIQHEFTRCPRPGAPETRTELNPAEHVCSLTNLEAILELIDAQRWLISQQEAALDCYETQAAGQNK